VGRKAPSAAPLLITLDQQARRPIFQQVFDGIRDAILTGRLKRGQQVPSTRLLAGELGIARSTVVLAYEHLVAEGYLGATTGAGSFVLHGLPDLPPRRPASDTTRPTRTAPRAVARRIAPYCGANLGAPQVSRSPVAFRIGEPAIDAFPARTWTKLYRERWLGNDHAFLRYGDPNGYRPLREAIVRYLAAARGVKADVEQVLLVRGTQQAIDLVSRVLLDPGDEAWVEDPGYLAVRSALAGAGARIVPVPVGRDGIDVDAGKQVAPNARLAYVAPSHQFPLGVTMSLSRRLELLDWASAAGAWVVEDDFDSEFRYVGRPLMALQGLDADDRVIYIGTFSKTLFPALRLGYLVVPKDLVSAFGRVRTLTDYLSPTIEQAVVADFINEGHFARHIRRMRSLYRARQDALVAAAREHLADFAVVSASPTGMHLIAWLRSDLDDRRVGQLAYEAGIEAAPLSLYCANASHPPALVLGYAAVSEEAMTEAVRGLRDVLIVAQ
jgi:GntR family transcriptional regulator/MocR family aminotransferase